jgi:hypothetical protein
MRLRAFGAEIADLSAAKGGVARRHFCAGGILRRPSSKRDQKWPKPPYDAPSFVNGCHLRPRSANPASRHSLSRKPRLNDTACHAAGERRMTLSWDGCGHAPEDPDQGGGGPRQGGEQLVCLCLAYTGRLLCPSQSYDRTANCSSRCACLRVKGAGETIESE